MKRIPLLIGISLFAALAAMRASALIHQEFPGLDRMIVDSDHVVVATALSAPATEGARPSSRTYRLLVLSVLKGSLRPGDTPQVTLVPEMMWPVTTGAAVPAVIPSEYYVLFLSGSGASLTQMVMPGSLFWIPTRELLAKQPADARSAVAAYLELTMQFLEKRRAEVGEEIRKYLAPSSK